MGRKRKNPPQLPIFDERLLIEAFEKANVKARHVRPIYQWVLNNPDAPLSALPLEALQIPQRAAAVLENFVVTTSRVAKKEESQIDHTVKLLVRLHDGKEVEAVIINHLGDPFRPEPTKLSGQRATLCLSSQVGCAMGCTFCATGQLGLDGNLLAGEILEQMYHARRVRPDIQNVVFMGMGEPLDNYDNVVAAVRGLTAPYLFSLPHRGVTVSTVGVTNRIEQLAVDCPSVKLAFSLHAPTQELRLTIVPSAKAYPLDKIMAALDRYGAGKKTDGKRQGMVMIEYVMLKDVNDQKKHAQQLVKLLKGKNTVINLIPFNTYPGAPPFETPPPATVSAFIDVLAANDLRIFERRHHGRDINAACGQLAKLERDIEACVGDNKLSCEITKELAEDGKQRAAQSLVPLAAGVLAVTTLCLALWRRR